MSNGNYSVNERLAVMEARVVALEEDVRNIRDDIKGLRNAVITFAFTVAGSAVAVLLALTQIH